MDNEERVISDTGSSFAAKIAAAATLWALVDRAQKAIETFKVEARKQGAPANQSVVHFNGDGMSQCKVVFPGPQVVLSPGFDEAEARKQLGPFFDVIFQTVTTLRSSDPAATAGFPPDVVRYLATITTLKPSTPRVSLATLPGVEEVK